MQRAITGAALITTRRTHKNGTVDRSCAGNERFRLSDCSLRSRNTFLDRVNGCATVSLHGNVLIIFVETRLNQNMPPTFLLLPENPLALSFFLCPRMRTRQEILSHSLETIFPRVVLIYHRRFATSSWSVNYLLPLKLIRRLARFQFTGKLRPLPIIPTFFGLVTRGHCLVTEE